MLLFAVAKICGTMVFTTTYIVVDFGGKSSLLSDRPNNTLAHSCARTLIHTSVTRIQTTDDIKSAREINVLLIRLCVYASQYTFVR